MGHFYSLFHFLIEVNFADLYRNFTLCCFPRQTYVILSFQGVTFLKPKELPGMLILSVLLKTNKMLEMMLLAAQTPATSQSKV